MKGLMNMVRILLSGILTLQACQSSSFLNRDKRKLSLESEMAAESQEEYRQRSIQVLTSQFTDSSQLDYQVSIYPLDTFSFSPDKGFTGRASGVVIKGKATRMMVLTDSGFRTDAASYQRHTATASDLEMDVKEEAKIREKERRMPGRGVGVMLFVLFVGLIAYYRYKRN